VKYFGTTIIDCGDASQSFKLAINYWTFAINWQFIDCQFDYSSGVWPWPRILIIIMTMNYQLPVVPVAVAAADTDCGQRGCSGRRDGCVGHDGHDGHVGSGGLGGILVWLK
jgi:hypothetical protein